MQVIKQQYLTLLLLFFLSIVNANTKSGLFAPSATISGTTTVCQNTSGVEVTFTGSGGTAPYTFTYTINGGTPQTVITTSGNSVDVPVITATAGTFTYSLISVKDSTNATQNQNGTAIVTVNSPPTIDFTFTNDTCSGTNIQFTSMNTGTGTYSYSWDFGDGITSTLQNPTHSFDSLGCGIATFNVKLTVTGGGCIVIKTYAVKVKQKPDVSFTDPKNVDVPFSNCDNASSSPVYSITVINPLPPSCVTSYSINWDTANTANPPIENNITFPISHTYNQLGVYTMTITAMGSNGCSNTVSYQVKNISSPGGGLSMPLNVQNICAPTPNIDVAISGWGTNSLDTTYTVDYGDLTSPIVLTQNQLVKSSYYVISNPASSAAYPIPHSFATTSCPTYYTITLNITNACNANPPQTATIYVITKPIANFTAPSKACDGSNVLFTNTTTSGYGNNCVKGSVSYTWNFGDPASGTSNIINTGYTTAVPNASHIFSAPGTYTVTLTASNNACGASVKTQQICIEPPLIPLFTLNTNAGCIPLPVTTNNDTVTTNPCSSPAYTWSVTYASGNCGASVTPILDQTTTNASYNFTVPGTYTIKLTVTNSCTPAQTTTQVVTVKKPPTVALGNIADFCQSATLTPTAVIDGCPNASILSYLWTFPGGTPSNATTQLPPVVSYATIGIHTVSLAAANECGTTSATSNTFVVKSAATVQNENITICSGVPFSVTPSNATAGNTIPVGTTYSWLVPVVTGGMTGGTAGTNQTSISGTLINPTNSIQTATYNIIPKSGNCSGVPFTVIVTVNPSPVITFSPAPQTICSGSTSAIVTLTSSTAGATYSWTAVQPIGITGVVTSGTNTIPAQILSNTTNAPITVTYNATVTTTAGSPCAGAVYPYTIIVNPTSSITESFTPTVCSGSSFTVTPTSSTLNIIPTGTTYSWVAPTVTGGMTGGAAGNTQSSLSATLTNPIDTAQTATYTITPSTNGCSGASFTVTVTVYPKPTITNVIPPAICSGTSFSVIPSNGGGNIVPTGTTYAWTVSANTNITGQSSSSAAGVTTISQTLTNISNTNQIITYTVTPTSGGCSGTPFTIIVTVNPKPSIGNITPSAICSGASFIVNPSSGGDTIVPTGTTYTWGNPVSNPLGAVTGGSAEAVGQNNISQTLTNTTDDVATLTYTVTPISGTCTGSPFTITVTLSPIPIVSPQTAIICSTTAFSISPINAGENIVPLGTTYTWTTPKINPLGSITGATSETVPQTNISQTLINTTASPATVTYTVIPTSGTCVGNSFSVTVTVNPSINPNVVVNNNTCFGVNTATITTNIIGGIPPYSIAWTGPNGFTSAATNISNLAPGNYDFTVNDSGNCPFSKTYAITEPAEIVITTVNKSDITCFGSSNGAIAINVTGGIGSYGYTWTNNGNPFAVTQNISNLNPGVYMISVTDANNCGPKTASFTITEPSVLGVNLVSKTDVLCYGAATGAITVNTVGGTPIQISSGVFDYDFSWTGPNGFTSNSQNLNNIYAGKYDLVITDANGCTNNLSVALTQSPELIIAYTTTPIVCYGDNNASISASISGGNPSYQYQWSNLATTLNQTNLSAGDYTITVTDNTGCQKIQTINIPEAPLFKVDPVVKNISCYGAHNGSIALNFVGGIAPVTLVWSDGSTSGTTRNNLGPGTYSVVITDSKPCTISKTFTIVEPQKLVVAGNTTNAFDCDDANSGAINLLVAGGSGPFTYSWSNGDTTEDLTNIPAGNYSVTVTDLNGCSETKQYSILRQPPIAIVVDTKTEANCDTKTVKQIFTANVTGGIPPYTIQWSRGQVTGVNNEIMETSANGIVEVKVTDSYGCISHYIFTVDIPKLDSAGFESESYGHTTFGIYSIGDPIQFTTTSNGDFTNVSWDFGDGTYSTELNPVHTYVIPKDYVVTQTVTYPFGCVYVKKITLTIEKGYVLVVPTAFTPNNDSINDTYRPVTKNLKNVRLDIYDTWGSLVYSETGDVLRGWDAKIKGQNAENGNYNCKISAETFYGTIVGDQKTFVLIK